MNERHPKRIHIIGGAGSGKSYLARRLSALFDLPVCDLDDLFWANDRKSYGVRAEPELRDKELCRFVAQEAWIVEGVYHQWVAESFRRAELVIVLQSPVLVRDMRIIRRFFARKLGVEHSTKKETFRGLLALLRWNHQYDRDNLVRALDYLKSCKHKVNTFGKADEAIAYASRVFCVDSNQAKTNTPGKRKSH